MSPITDPYYSKLNSLFGAESMKVCNQFRDISLSIADRVLSVHHCQDLR